VADVSGGAGAGDAGRRRPPPQRLPAVRGALQVPTGHQGGVVQTRGPGRGASGSRRQPHASRQEAVSTRRGCVRGGAAAAAGAAVGPPSASHSWTQGSRATGAPGVTRATRPAAAAASVFLFSCDVRRRFKV